MDNRSLPRAHDVLTEEFTRLNSVSGEIENVTEHYMFNPGTTEYEHIGTIVGRNRPLVDFLDRPLLPIDFPYNNDTDPYPYPEDDDDDEDEDESMTVKQLNNSSKIKINTDEFECFCLETVKSGEIIRTLICDHMFHQHCIDVWFEDNYTCPMCRRSLVD